MERKEFEETIREILEKNCPDTDAMTLPVDTQLVDIKGLDFAGVAADISNDPGLNVDTTVTEGDLRTHCPTIEALLLFAWALV